MMTLRRRLVPRVIAAAILVAAYATRAGAQAPRSVPPPANRSGVHDFDFQVGDWLVHHRVKGSGNEWSEFDGTCSNRALMGGAANVEDHRFDKRTGVSHGVAL